MRWFRKSRRAVPNPVSDNIATIAQLEQRLRQARSPLERACDAIARFAGSLPFLLVHVVIFAVWMTVNASWFLGDRAFDPYPFIFLNFMLAAEAVILSTFVLMSQNRHSRQAEHWGHVGLQVALLNERENTKMLQMVLRICERLEVNGFRQDRELLEMLGRTNVLSLAEQLKEAREAEQKPPAP